MTYRVRILENDRISTRGLRRAGAGVALDIDEDEVIPVVIDWSHWLAGDTITAVVNSATGVTVSGASNTTTTATMKLAASSAGFVEHRITTATGAKKELRIEVNGATAGDDYR